MMQFFRWTIQFLLLLLLTGGAHAKDGISLDEAVEHARSSTGGRVISAETKERDGRRVYNIRLLSEGGKVKKIRIDSRSGRQLKGRSKRRD